MQDLTPEQAQALQFQMMQQHLLQMAGAGDPNNPMAAFHASYPFFHMGNMGIDGCVL